MTGREGHLERVADEVERVAAADSAYRGALADRNAAIRAALADGVPYALLGEVTGLTRAALVKVRRG